VYSNVNDTAQASTCSGSCAKTWTPLTSVEAPVSAGGINPALLGTLLRTDGQRQVTYGGHPLYTYSGDKHHLGLAGQGADGSWFTIAASGDLVKGTP
jgi:predicted lipoprotein with Yx(FWY)xxD motif